MKPRLALVGSILILGMLAPFPPAVVAGQVSNASTGGLTVNPSGTPGAKTFTIIVSSAGFNSSGISTLSLQVNQGDNVTIKFVYGDGSLSFDNPHLIKIEGYNVQTQPLDRKAPVQRISIIAGTPGKFQFHCIVPCFGMENLQEGVIDVSPSSKQGSSPIGTSLAPVSIQSVQGHLVASSRLTDVNGTAVAGVIVGFFVSTDFGEMNIGHNATSSDGSVLLTYSSSLSRQTTITARFDGNGNYLSSASAPATVSTFSSRNANATTPFVNGQSRAIDLRLVGIPQLPAYIVVMVAITVIAGVWSVYVFVLTQILAVRRTAKMEAKS